MVIRNLTFLCVFLSFAVSGSFAADNWPTFRGPERTAVAPDTDLLREWPGEGPELIWQASGVGQGYSSLAIVGDRIYTMGDSIPDTDGDEYLICLDRAKGATIWKLKTGQPLTQRNPTWEGPRSTPTVDGDRVYALSPHGRLMCVSTDGELIWEKHLKEDFQGDKADGWGYSESVLIDGDHLICTPGGPKNTVLALNKQNGETVWTSSRDGDRGAGHASIVISEIGGTKVYVTTTGSGAMGVRASDGELLWTYDIEKTTAVIPTPIIRGDLVFFTAGYNRGGALLKQIPGDNHSVSIDEIYPLNPELSNKHGGVVLVGDHLYGAKDSSQVLFCADLLTGDIVWQERGAGNGSVSVVAADEHLYYRFQSGEMMLVESTPDGMISTGQFTVPGSGDRPSWSHPVILDGMLYLREGNDILCYRLRK